MSAPSPAPVAPPRLILCVLLFAASLAGALVFANAFKDVSRFTIDDELCGETAPIESAASHAHDSHDQKADDPAYYLGGLWSSTHNQAANLDAAMLSAAAGQPIVCQSALSVGEELIIIDRSPIQHGEAAEPSPDQLPILVLSIDHAGSVSSIEYPAGGALQTYITAEQDNYSKILIVEPLPGPKPDPDEDWTYLNRDGIDKIEFLTPKRKASPAETVQALYAELRPTSPPASTDLAALLDALGSQDKVKAADARMQLVGLSPYKVVPALNDWIAAAGEEAREQRVYEALMVRRGLGVHADRLIAEAVDSENAQLRTLAARAIGELAEVTTDPIGLLTPLAEDSEQAVRYEALIATRSIPGRRAAGVVQLVAPYEMSDAMLGVYKGTLAQMLAYGEPVAADSKFSRTLRMPIGEALGLERDLIVCNALLQRVDLPDDKIDEVLGKLAEINGQGSLVTLLNLLETMNPSTLAKREVLLEKLVAWKANELNAQTPRLKELALGNGASNLRSAAAGAMIMSSSVKDVFAQLDGSAIPYEGLAWVKDPAVLKRWAEPISLRIVTEKSIAMQTTIAAIDAVRLLPADAITKAMVDGLHSIATGPEAIDLRFAAIRAINALPDAIKPQGIADLTLTTLTVTAVAGMKYDKETLTVIAGRPVELTLVNPDTMEHNLVITLPGRAQEVGIAMSADPTAAAAMGYVPNDSDAVLHYTTMTKPGTSDTIRFFAPTKPGSYEYVCTFPGHYPSMHGVLEVVAP